MKSLNDYDERLVALVAADLGDGTPQQDVLDYFNRSYDGSFDSLADWAEWHLTETGKIEDLPDYLDEYVNNWGDFNFEKYAMDEEESERIFSVELGLNRVHVFKN